MEEKTTDNRNTFAIKTFLKDYLDLRKDKDNELETVDSIRKGVEFKGANLWILIFAIFMASLGLNVNSTAVIIGAMLISPLMGPIMGVGLSVGLNDFELMKRSLKSFLITTLFSVTTATIFFLIICSFLSFLSIPTILSSPGRFSNRHPIRTEKFCFVKCSDYECFLTFTFPERTTTSIKTETTTMIPMTMFLIATGAPAN